MSVKAARWNRVCAIVIVLAIGALTPVGLRAQATEGASELLLPVGARLTALGMAFAAERGGEAIWSNPAGIARVTKPEFALDHFQTTFITGGESVSLILPAGAIGVFGLGVRLFSYDSIPSTEATSEASGVVRPRVMTLGATFAATFGDRLSAGVDLVLYRSSAPCSGTCGDVALGTAMTGALDAGIQYVQSPTSPVQFGVAVRNLGRKLQTQDKPQADELPARLHIGASYRPRPSGWDPALRVLGTTEIVVDRTLSSNELRMGAEVGYLSGSTMLHLRGGYVLQGSGSANSAGVPSLGLGLVGGRVQLDLTRIFETFSTGLGVPPTYVSVRIGL